MTTAKDVLKMIKDKDVKYVDFRFTDPRGKWQHVTFDVGMIDEDTFAEGHDVRRLLDRRLEGDQRVRHAADAGPGLRHASIRSSPRPRWRWSATCSSRPPASPTTAIRAPSPRRPKPCVKSTGHRRHRLFRPRGRVLRVRRRALFDDAVQHRLQARLGRIPDQLRHRLRRRQPRPPHRHQEGLLPGPAAGLASRTCARRCSSAMARDGRARSRSITTRWRPPSTSSA